MNKEISIEAAALHHLFYACEIFLKLTSNIEFTPNESDSFCHASKAVKKAGDLVKDILSTFDFRKIDQLMKSEDQLRKKKFKDAFDKLMETKGKSIDEYRKLCGG